MSGRAYLSIGDVLTLLRQEFPDVTISKIRFLESQGLVNPERTPSGYRKFYEPDVERLRWVLRQQREHFLPLKVIKGRLEEDGEHENGRSQAGAHPAAAGVVDPGRPTPASLSRPGSGSGEPLPGLGGSGTSGASLRHERHERHETAAASPAVRARAEAGAAATTTSPPSRSGAASGRAGATVGPRREASASSAAAKKPSQPGAEGEASVTRLRPPEPPAVLAEGDMTAEELASASGCAAPTVALLESYGLISSRVVGGVAYFGDDALAVARTAAAFAAFGVEPRHLRLHKHSAEREAGFIEQIVLPLLKQRNPESRQRAHETVGELSRLGQELRALLLARALRDQLGG